MRFNEWLDTLVEEKGLNIEQRFEVKGESGPNFIPLGVVIEHIKITHPNEKKAIKNTLVMIDYQSGDVMGYFKHLAKAIAI